MKPGRLNKTILISSILGMLFLATGCSSKAYTPTRSSVKEQARERGIHVPSIQEERRRFHEVLHRQEKRLSALMESRVKRLGYLDQYRIGAGDKVEVKVFDVPELNLAVRVRPTGSISLPLIGQLQVTGMTESDLVTALNDRLSQYVIEPQTSVFVQEYQSKKMSIVGAVDNPGSYSLRKGNATLLELLGEAGGVKEKADNYVQFIPAEFISVENQVASARARYSFNQAVPAASETQSIEVPLSRILGTDGNAPLSFPLLPGDVLIVPDAGKVQVDGEVKDVGAFDVSRGMSLMGALAAAGGITYGANVHQVELVREVGEGKKVHYVMDLTRVVSGDEDDVLLKSGDVVRVPTDPNRRMAQDTFEAISKLMNIGLGGTFSVLP